MILELPATDVTNLTIGSIEGSRTDIQIDLFEFHNWTSTLNKSDVNRDTLFTFTCHLAYFSYQLYAKTIL